MTINNWRTGLSFPKEILVNERDNIEYLYEDEHGNTCSLFDEEQALAVLLLSGVVYLNSNWWEKTWPEEAKNTVALGVDISDIFAWGSADSELIVYNQIEEVYRYWEKDHNHGTIIWAMIRKREMPQGLVEDSIHKAGIWDVDALKSEHGLRPNYHDGISDVLARRKYHAYKAWCRECGKDPLPYDDDWWNGWKTYTEAHPKWCDAAWKSADDEAIMEWKKENGYI